MNSVLIIGKPNSGKSLLFNRLTGMRQKVANFPGVTVEVKSGQAEGIEYTDFPGIYSFQPLTKDEEISVEKFKQALEDERFSAIICTLDATRLERSLVMGLQAQQEAKKVGKPILFALNMMDFILSKHRQINTQELEKTLGSPVVALSAKKNQGIDQLKERVKELIQAPEKYLPQVNELTQDDLLVKAKDIYQQFGIQSSLILKGQNNLDRFFLSSWLGGAIFVFIMLLLFQSIFSWATPLMDGVEFLIGTLGEQVSHLLPNGVLRDFVNDALFGGFGSFLVFVPQIFVLTFLIGVLEDSGYLARAAVICHKPLDLFGLTGKSFVPLLSGHACAIPAIMAARTIESPKKRLLTILTIPLTACSARLPVYSLLIALLIPSSTFFGGLIGWRGLTFFALYAFGIGMALLASAVMSKTVYRTESDSPFILELPPYRMPHWRPLLQRSLTGAWTFISKAGAMIFAVTVVVWFLGYFPGQAGDLENSYLAKAGQWIEPIFSPLGLDWKYGVAILTSFLAREVFVGTLGTFLGIESADENILGLSAEIEASGLSIASGFSLLIFYAIALQCASTLAVLKKETGNYKLPIITFVVYSLAAYLFAWLTFQVLS